MSHLLLRGISWLNRFGTLRRVERAFAHQNGSEILERSLFGYRMELDVARSTAQQLLLVEGERFIEERHLLRRLLREGMTVVDVGANIGYYVLLFERSVGRRGKVIAIEPSVENLPELQRNIEINAFGNLTLHAVALGSEHGLTGLRAGINSGIADRSTAEYEVPLVRLDEIVDEPVHFLKIDVEGYEGQVLEGATGLLERHRPILFLELHPHIVGQFGFRTSDILRKLSGYYRTITLYERERPEDQSLLAKVAIRYGGRDALLPIADPPAYVERYDDGSIVHTFWAVCEP